MNERIYAVGFQKQRDVLYWIRKKRKLSRKSVHQNLGIAINVLVNYENAYDGNKCSMRVIMLLCQFYGVKLSKFYQMVETAENTGCDVEKMVEDMLK